MMTNSRRDPMTRRQLVRRLTALGLTAAAATRLAEARAADGRYRIAFANVTEAGELFVQLGDGIEAAAAKAGVGISRYDNAFSSETALRNARLMAQERPDLILEYNAIQGVGPALRRVFDNAGIPFIAINIAIPGGHWFNLVNRDLGADTARGVVGFAMEKGWSAADTTVIIVQSGESGDEVNDCVRYFYITAAELMDMPRVAPADINPLTTRISANGVQVDGKGQLELSYAAVRNVLQTLPRGRNILLYAVNDDSTIGAWRAVEEAGRAARTMVAGLGGSAAALHELRTNPSWVAEGTIFMSEWGQYLIAMAVAILNGAEPPALTKCPQAVLTKATVDEFYDAEANVVKLPPLDESNRYLAATGVLQLFGNVQGLD